METTTEDAQGPKLASEFNFAGHVLKMAFREKSIAIYARARPSREPHEYELVVIQNRPQSVMPDGSIIPAREGYPKNSEWGKCAWSFPIREKELVWEPARRMTLMEGPFGKWMREMRTFYKKNGRLSDWDGPKA